MLDKDKPYPYSRAAGDVSNFCKFVSLWHAIHSLFRFLGLDPLASQLRLADNTKFTSLNVSCKPITGCAVQF